MKAKLTTRENGNKWLKLELGVDDSVIEYTSTSPAFTRARQLQAPPSVTGGDPERHIRNRILGLMADGWEVREETDDLSQGRWSIDLKFASSERQKAAWEVLTGRTGMPEGEVSRTYADGILVNADPPNLRLFAVVNEADIAEGTATRIAAAIRCAAPGAECHDFTAEPVLDFMDALRQHRRYEALDKATLDRLERLRVHLVEEAFKAPTAVFVGF